MRIDIDAKVVADWVDGPPCSSVSHAHFIMDCMNFLRLIPLVKIKHCHCETNRNTVVWMPCNRNLCLLLLLPMIFIFFFSIITWVCIMRGFALSLYLYHLIYLILTKRNKIIINFIFNNAMALIKVSQLQWHLNYMLLRTW